MEENEENGTIMTTDDNKKISKVSITMPLIITISENNKLDLVYVLLIFNHFDYNKKIFIIYCLSDIPWSIAKQCNLT